VSGKWGGWLGFKESELTLERLWQLGGKFQRAKTSGVVLFVVVAWVHFQSEKKFFVGAAFSTDVFFNFWRDC
jgi:hypothetical protein